MILQRPALLEKPWPEGDCAEVSRIDRDLAYRKMVHARIVCEHLVALPGVIGRIVGDPNLPAFGKLETLQGARSWLTRSQQQQRRALVIAAVVDGPWREILGLGKIKVLELSVVLKLLRCGSKDCARLTISVQNFEKKIGSNVPREGVLGVAQRLCGQARVSLCEVQAVSRGKAWASSEQRAADVRTVRRAMIKELIAMRFASWDVARALGMPRSTLRNIVMQERRLEKVR
jgi:hypothetical protein